MVTNHSHIALQQIFKSKRDYISYANDISYWIFLSSLTQSHFCNLQILISFLNNISSIIDNYAYSFSKLYFPPCSVLIDFKLLSKIVVLPEVTDVTSFFLFGECQNYANHNSYFYAKVLFFANNVVYSIY